MSRAFFKKYLHIILEANSYRSLNDAGESYSPGSTQIWYVKDEYAPYFNAGYENLSRNIDKIPNNIEETHTLVGSVAETNLDKIYSMMQSVIWNPSGDGDALIADLGLDHSDMSTGDVIVLNNKIMMVDTKGFVDLSTGDEA